MSTIYATTIHYRDYTGATPQAACEAAADYERVNSGAPGTWTTAPTAPVPSAWAADSAVCWVYLDGGYQYGGDITSSTGTDTPGTPGEFNWSSEAHLMQALLIVMAVIVLFMGYRAGDKT